MMKLDLKSTYLFLVTLALLSSLYLVINGGINEPKISVSTLKRSLSTVSQITEVKETREVKKSNSSDRMISPLYSFSYADGSTVLTAMVRMRKRGDFRIEAYGPITKDVEVLEIKNPEPNQYFPVAVAGSLANKYSIQTCLVPNSRDNRDIGVSLQTLTSASDKLVSRKKDLMMKILGQNQNRDYTCMVITYQPNAGNRSQNAWLKIINAIRQSQHSL